MCCIYEGWGTNTCSIDQETCNYNEADYDKCPWYESNVDELPTKIYRSTAND